MSEKILEKLSKIKAHAESAKQIGNEAEAEAFAGMLQQLLLKHKLDLTDIEYINEMKSEPIEEKWPECTYVKGNRVFKDAPEVKVSSRRVQWIEHLASIVAHAHSCQTLVSSVTSNVCFVGHTSNVAISEYLFITMLRFADRMSDKAAKKFRRDAREQHGGPGFTPEGYRASWLEAFVQRVHERLLEERNKFGSNSMAIVRVNKEAIAVRDYLDKRFEGRKPAEPVRSRYQSHNELGYRDGRAAADKLNLKANAVNEGKPNRQIE